MNDLQDKKSAIVIDKFLKLQNNTVSNIAIETGLLEKTVHKIINKYLNNKIING